VLQTNVATRDNAIGANKTLSVANRWEDHRLPVAASKRGTQKDASELKHSERKVWAGKKKIRNGLHVCQTKEHIKAG